MYEYIRGKLAYITPLFAILDIGGIGYQIHIPLSTSTKLLPEETVLLFTAHIVREDSQKLFGFLTKNERDLFLKIIEVSGFGPKLALALLGHVTLEELYGIIQEHDAKSLAKIPGIGKKMAERLIIELQDKIQHIHLDMTPHDTISSQNTLFQDACSALVHLGYQAPKAKYVIKQVYQNFETEPDLSTLITTALKHLS